jgi:predicted nucleic acid-binding protein
VRSGQRRFFIGDTSFVSHHERGSLGAEASAWVADALERKSATALAISVVTVAEVRFGAWLAQWGSRRRTQSERWLMQFLQVPVSQPVADAWAALKVAARKRGRSFSVNDLWIAATGYATRTPVVTCDRDFLQMRDLGVGVVYLAPRTQPAGDA